MAKEENIGAKILDFNSGRHASEESDWELMLTDVSMRTEYFAGSSRQKAEMLLNNFASIPEIIEGQYDILKADIICEQDYQRNRDHDDIRVQSSHLSDPTATIAMRNVELDDALRTGDFSSIMLSSRMSSIYRRTLRSIEDMRSDYTIVKAFIRMLPEQDRCLLNDFYECKGNMRKISELADRYELQVHSLYAKIRRIKIRIAELAVPGFDRKYRGKTA